MPSPFTRVGPGPASIIKPDLVFYGGNSGMHNGKRIDHGVRSFNLDDEDERFIGTSFSTPAVTRVVADLAYMMKELPVFKSYRKLLGIMLDWPLTLYLKRSALARFSIYTIIHTLPLTQTIFMGWNTLRIRLLYEYENEKTDRSPINGL